MGIYRISRPSLISFSGGRTSGYLLKKIIDAYEGKLPYDIIVCFANTGKEDERTLQFVKDVEENWGVEIWWCEYVRDETKPPVVWKGKSPLVGQHAMRTVTFETASRSGEPFEQLIDVLAEYRKIAKNEPSVLPNPVQRICSSQLKIRTMGRFMERLGFKKFSTALGIRYDEPSRAAPLLSCGIKYGDHLLPLYDARVTEPMVMEFWKTQPFDLGLQHDKELGTYEGNCDFCFLKKNAKIKRLAQERPNDLKWWAEQEKRTGANFKKNRFTYTDLLEGRVPLGIVEKDDDGKEQEACFCTD